MQYLRNAVKHISSEERIVNISSVYETLPYGRSDQPDFLNAVVVINTGKDAAGLYEFLKKVESETGRTTSERWGEREIDIDILFFNKEIIDNNFLTVPHKGIPEREFVLVPLNEIDPAFIHPQLGKTAAEMLENVTVKNIIRIFPEKII